MAPHDGRWKRALGMLVGVVAGGAFLLPTFGEGPAESVGGAATQTAPAWNRPRFEERRVERGRMVEGQIAHPRDLRAAVIDERVLDAMRQVPRHLFVRRGDERAAYGDGPLPIGYGQTISQPYIVALMTEALRIKRGAKVLEIGTGSGYQAAVLAELTPEVYTIEIVKPLAEEAAARLKRLGYETVRVRSGDGYGAGRRRARSTGSS